MAKAIAELNADGRYVRRARSRQRLLRMFWIGSGLVAGIGVITAAGSQSSVESTLGAFLIATMALLPFYLWCSGKAAGLPIYPIFAVCCLWTYGVPLISNHPIVVKYTTEQQIVASLTVAGFLALGTGVWFYFLRLPKRPVGSYRALEYKTGIYFFSFALAANILLTFGIMGDWFSFARGYISLARGIITGLNTLAIFVMAYIWGESRLSRKMAALFALLLLLNIAASAASLLIVGTLTMSLLAATGYIMGRRRVPWVLLLVMLCCLVPLHYGKSAMRDKYWASGSQKAIQPWEYGDLFDEWLGYSINTIFGSDSNRPNQQTQSFSERLSLMHLLLLAQDRTGEDVPYMMGATYSIIPELLVPRFINPDKLYSTEGLTLINIHYGIQTREATYTTSIGWGQLNEAYANFGYFGVALLAVLIGAGYGLTTRWALGTSVLSARSLFAIVLMSFAFQSEFSTSIYMTALFQSVVPLMAVTFLVMKVQRVEGHPALTKSRSRDLVPHLSRD